MLKALEQFWSDEEGATMIEYALLAALIGVASIAGLKGLQVGINDLLEKIKNALT